MIEVSEKRIQHKDPKWFDLREQLNLPERSLGTFSYDRPRFDPISSSATEGIQAAHTYIDTIYMHKGTRYLRVLPTKIRSGSEANIPYALSQSSVGTVIGRTALFARTRRGQTTCGTC